MAQAETIQLRPTGWETDPPEERFKLSCIDCIPVCAYNNYLIFWRLDDATKEQAIRVLRGGLEKTLSQVRYMCGTIEQDPDGGLSFVKKRDSTAKLVVMRYDRPGNQWPSMEDMEKAHFAERALGRDSGLWGIPTMTWGERPEAEPSCSPEVAAYQINLVRGGIVFSIQSHHYASDAMGFSNFTRQLAENCAAVAQGTPFPPWDPANIDVTRFTKDVPEEDMIDGPPIAQRHPGHPEQQAVLFHLPRSKAAQLKKMATPTDPEAHWISTYDAMCAFVWRALSRVRAPLHKPDLCRPLWWGEAVDMRPRLHNPPVPARMTRNVLAAALSDAAPVAAPTAAEVIAPEEVLPLARLAGYIRALTESCTEAYLRGVIDAIAPVRDKRRVNMRVDAYPPMSLFVTDHRPADVGGLDFGFGRPLTYRHVWGDQTTAGVILIYAPVQGAANPDEGCMFTITMEKELVPKLCADPEWSAYFEYRGVD